MTVPFLDLGRQYQALGKELDQAIREVMETGYFILGPNVKALEEEFAAYCRAPHGVGVASGTDALLLALEALGIGPGDEVVTTPFTFVATAEMISRTGATPVFADIDPATFNIDPDDLARRITSRTKAIIAVHLYGHPADMEAIMVTAQRHGLRVIEDAAQAVGAECGARRVGGIGHIGCFSFFPTKNLGAAGDGGFVTTTDVALADRIVMLRQHGARKKYVHEVMGWSSRLDELQAAILRVKLRYLETWTAARRAHAAAYRERLAGLPIVLPVERSDCRAVYHLFTIRTPRRDELQKFLQARGVATMVHYPVPLHQQPLYRHLAATGLPESERASREVLSLPLYPELTPKELAEVAAAVTAFFKA
ncbi:MAG: DegT/DnrJ/EryC1/StrS family aminotransferase [Candidatus Rokubacteria bacterium]|nr:DegT/DnrJ/EryC1/StrS family aminotransferase [Candidatus Rokubacteria bacterium]